MFDTINGSPVHPLVVHAIVVLLPLAAVGTIAIVLVRRWRVTYGPLVVGGALLSTVLIPMATASGEALEERVGDPGRHAELGEQLLWFSLPLLVLVAALVWIEWRASRVSDVGLGTAARSRTWTNVIAALSVVAAVAVSVQVVRVGDSGAKAVWGNAAAQVRR